MLQMALVHRAQLRATKTTIATLTKNTRSLRTTGCSCDRQPVAIAVRISKRNRCTIVPGNRLTNLRRWYRQAPLVQSTRSVTASSEGLPPMIRLLHGYARPSLGSVQIPILVLWMTHCIADAWRTRSHRSHHRQGSWLRPPERFLRGSSPLL